MAGVKPKVMVSPAPLISYFARGNKTVSGNSIQYEYPQANSVEWYDTNTDLVATFYDMTVEIENAGQQTRFSFAGNIAVAPSHPYIKKLLSYNTSPDVMLTLLFEDGTPLPDLITNTILSKSYHTRLPVTFPIVAVGSNQPLKVPEFTRPLQIDINLAPKLAVEFDDKKKFGYGV